ncbi:hypothetical protein [Maricaulis sp.]|uniref:hypothetical protein n=1 Tax=Maricaulis sp. TaxID=1486257 RepID=UPI002B272C57|nr:hypothetical protein [Maricaulis sp.]
MALTTLEDRRNARAPLRVLTLDDTALRWRDASSDPDGIADHLIALDEVRQVRLSVEMAGQASQVVCRVTAGNGDTVAFGSMRCAGMGQWDANARDFQAFLGALHAALEGRSDRVDYIEGSSVRFLVLMTALGGLLTVLAGAAFAKLFLVDENAIGLVLIPAIALGVWMMRLFWPRAPKHYDPETYSRPSDPETPSPV